MSSSRLSDSNRAIQAQAAHVARQALAREGALTMPPRFALPRCLPHGHLRYCSARSRPGIWESHHVPSLILRIGRKVAPFSDDDRLKFIGYERLLQNDEYCL